MPSIETQRKLAERVGTQVAAEQTPTILPPNFPNTPNPWQRGPLPPPMVQSSDQQRGWQISTVPVVRVSPLPPASNPAVGAAAASQAIAVNAGSSVSIGLLMPGIFSVAGSRAGNNGTFDVTLVPEAAHTAFMGPAFAPTIPNVPSFDVKATGGNNAAVSSFTIGPISPTFANELGIAVVATGSVTASAGWAEVDGVNATAFFENFVGSSPISLIGTISGTATWSAVLGSFATNGTPAAVSNTNNNSAGFSATNTVATSFLSNTTAGNSLFCAVTMLGPSDLTIPTISDTQGNTWALIGSAFSGAPGSRGAFLYAAQNTAGGADTVTILRPSSVFASSGLMQVFEVTNLLTVPPPAIPTFRLIDPSDIPSLDASKISTGLLALARGGTDADLSATGGANQVLQQSSSGAAITVGQLDFPNLSGVGKISKYNNISTVANGVPSEYATVDLTAQTAAITTTTLYVVPASGAGQYRLIWNAKVTTAAGVSSTLGALTVVYTDPDGVSQTITAAAQSNAGVIETTDAGNITTTVLLGVPMLLNCKASTNITYAFGYASNPANTMGYNLHIKLEAL